MITDSSQSLSEDDLSQLSNWRLLREFQSRLSALLPAEDSARRLQAQDYFSLILFGLFNPVVNTMRGLCAASHFEKVQSDVCRTAVSLGSFSEAQHVFEPGLLEALFSSLVEERDLTLPPPGVAPHRWNAIDSTVFAAVPRMVWAQYRERHYGPRTQRAVRLHISFNLLDESPVKARVTAGKVCERAAFRQMIEPGEFYVGDRYYGEDYALFEELQQAGCGFITRLRNSATVEVIEEFEVPEEARQEGVFSDSLVKLGCRTAYRSIPLRLVRIQRPGQEELLVVTNQLGLEVMPAVLVGAVYRSRWQIELFFRWLKCILKAQHWMAHSERGVAIQIYCALIAALLLARHTGKRPTKRQMELLQFYQLGVVEVHELMVHLKLKDRTKH